jgi:hypothetical protein
MDDHRGGDQKKKVPRTGEQKSTEADGDEIGPDDPVFIRVP